MFAAETKVKVISAPETFSQFVGQVGVIGPTGKSGETQMVKFTSGSGLYFKPEQLEEVV